MLVAEGQDHLAKFTEALTQTHAYLEDMGAAIAPEKSWNFTSCAEAKKILKTFEWPMLKKTIPVKDDFRYLGAHIATPKAQGRDTSLMNKRFKEAAGAAMRLSKIPIKAAAKVRAILGKAMPLALYGIEVAKPTGAMVQHLTSMIARRLAGPKSGADLDLAFQMIPEDGQADLDPVVRTLQNRVIGLRRALVKMPDLQSKARTVVTRYQSWGMRGTQAGPCHQPAQAPHPNHGSRKDWKDAAWPRGQVGYLLQSLHFIDARLDCDLGLHMTLEQSSHVLNTPFQAIKPAVGIWATTARAQARSRDRRSREGVAEVDQQVVSAIKKKLTDTQRRTLKKLHTLADWTAEKVQQCIDEQVDIKCKWCGAQGYNMDHLIWNCTHFTEVRNRARPDSAAIPCKLLPATIRRGLPHALQFADGAPFWSTQPADTEGVPVGTLETVEIVNFKRRTATARQLQCELLEKGTAPGKRLVT